MYLFALENFCPHVGKILIWKRANGRITASKTETQHIVPLSNYVLSILKNLYTITGENKYVFKSPFNKTQKGYINLTTLYGAMLRVGITQDQTCPHGFRATARTLLEEVLGERYEFIEQQLGHKSEIQTAGLTIALIILQTGNA